MSFEAIENLNPEELTSLYDDVIEDYTNITQCVCTTGEACSANGSYSYGHFFKSSVIMHIGIPPQSKYGTISFLMQSL